MDGLLIDSEGIYTTVVNHLLAPYGKQQTWAIKANLMGKPERAATLTLLSSLWPGPNHAPPLVEEIAPDCPFSIETFLADRNEVLEAAFRNVPAMPGAERLVAHLARHGVPICVATRSKRKNYEIKTARLAPIFDLFGERVVCGDDARLKLGKPFPDIFLLAASHGLVADGSEHDKLRERWTQSIRRHGEEHDGQWGGREAEVLVFEDAKPSVAAAKAAGMHVVWVPDPNLRALYPDEELGASQTINSLLDFDPTAWGLPPFDDELEGLNN